MGGRQGVKRAGQRTGSSVRVNPERAAALRRRQRQLALTWFFIGAALVVAIVLLSSVLPKPDAYERFAKCLAREGAVVYCDDVTSDCQAQKRVFGAAFTSVVYENCDYTTICQELKIAVKPSWILADGERIEGVQDVAALAAATGCEAPKGEPRMPADV